MVRTTYKSWKLPTPLIQLHNKFGINKRLGKNLRYLVDS